MLVGVGAAAFAFIALVYSLLFLAVQFASTTLTPRLNLFRDNPIVWRSFSYFTALLVFCFTGAFVIGNRSETTMAVPAFTLVSVLVALGFFRALQTRALQSVQVASAIDQVVVRGRDVIERMYPDPLSRTGDRWGDEVRPRTVEEPAQCRHVLWSGRAAVLQAIDLPALLDEAERAGVVVELCVAPGATIEPDAAVAVLHGPEENVPDRAVLGAIVVGHERSFEQDPAFALRILVDIALRALSPALNDPTTAVQALDGIDSLLRQLARRDLDVGRVRGADGAIRVLLPLPGWDDFVALAVDEIGQAGLGSLQVRRRLHLLLQELARLAPEPRRQVVAGRLEAAAVASR